MQLETRNYKIDSAKSSRPVYSATFASKWGINSHAWTGNYLQFKGSKWKVESTANYNVLDTLSTRCMDSENTDRNSQPTQQVSLASLPDLEQHHCFRHTQ